ncbi:hypothetical protein JAAARDRAFT_122449 [Jaapia argillacea MUCL 33604]|uniref:Hydrophobin n=1 Tax=Jaapia argillacea MUCL 33604 TaxID=933084 RepID=A0A067QGR7_9AGAM|nr:hypothetical protein JAAARDRAFT_122449 [Jaapia argillacea MUCL 33604]
MFSKLSIALPAFLAILAVATPTPNEPASSCTTGPIQCCDTVESASSPAAASLIKSLGIVLQDVTAEVGLTCSPITVVGVGSGSACSASPVCCTDNSWGGLISIGCVPVTL